MEISFEQFVASKRRVEDLRTMAGYGDGMEEKTAGFVYMSEGEDVAGFVIEIYGEEYQLILENSCWLQKDLADLERKLYDWAKGELNYEDNH